MSRTILFDTDVLIDAGIGVTEAIETLTAAEHHGDLGVSVVTHMELIVGCRNRPEQDALDLFLNRFDIVPLDRETSARAVELMRKYRLSHGLMIADSLIAATALETQAMLVSKNQRHFRFVADLQLLPYPALSADAFRR